MSLNDQDKITIAREYFIRADQGRRDILELFHEDAEIYFPKFGFGFARQSLFEMVKGFEGSLEYIRHDYHRLSFLQATIWSLKELHTVKCPVNLVREAKLLADVSATCSNFEMAKYPACTSISIPTIRERMEARFRWGKNRHW
jgi:hypothetical protein